VNRPLKEGDPAVSIARIIDGVTIPGAYAGKSMNCAHCHLSDELKDVTGAGRRAFADFARRTPIPAREGDARSRTLRNSPQLIDAARAPEHELLLHFDGEFATVEDLVRGGFTGRNFGWLENERKLATAHLARVIREDDGTLELGPSQGGSYARLLQGTDPALPASLRLPASYRLDVKHASDAQVLDAAARLVGAYLRSLKTEHRSPYDLFLARNGLPSEPAPGESGMDYARGLFARITALASPVFVTPADGKLETHDHPFEFGAKELEGMRIFLRETPDSSHEGIGNCASCHTPPHFTDFRLRNNGSAQEEYDRIHGLHSMLKLPIPGFAERELDPELSGPFSVLASVPDKSAPGLIDLGAWNVFGNPALKGPQPKLLAQACLLVKEQGLGVPCGETQALLPFLAGTFKTSGLRNISHSAPYMHTGLRPDLHSAILLYVRSAILARGNKLVNPDFEIFKIGLSQPDFAPLEAFLLSLDEDLTL
jgi:cytochrome c peroxidase